MSKTPPPGANLWVRSDTTAFSGRYQVVLSYGEDHAWSLTDGGAIAYALHVIQAANRADHDAAVLRMATSRLRLPLGDAIAGVLREVRKRRDAAPGPASPISLSWEPVVNDKLRTSLVLTVSGQKVGSLSVDEARAHALGVLDALAAVDLDTHLRFVLVDTIGVPDGTAAAAVDALGEYRELAGELR